MFDLLLRRSQEIEMLTLEFKRRLKAAAVILGVAEPMPPAPLYVNPGFAYNAELANDFNGHRKSTRS